jgi:hypothetical protein
MFYFCFHGNHSHNLRVNVYSVVSLVISNVKKMISVNTLPLLDFLEKIVFVPYSWVFSKYYITTFLQKYFYFSKMYLKGFYYVVVTIATKINTCVFFYFYEFSIKMQHMNQINSNVATIDKSPTA